MLNLRRKISVEDTLPSGGHQALLDSWNELFITCAQIPVHRTDEYVQLDLFKDVIYVP